MFSPGITVLNQQSLENSNAITRKPGLSNRKPLADRGVNTQTTLRVNQKQNVSRKDGSKNILKSKSAKLNQSSTLKKTSPSLDLKTSCVKEDEPFDMFFKGYSKNEVKDDYEDLIWSKSQRPNDYDLFETLSVISGFKRQPTPSPTKFTISPMKLGSPDLGFMRNELESVLIDDIGLPTFRY